jgi:hypothetical protein
MDGVGDSFLEMRALSDFVAGLRLEPSQRVMGALAIMLAETLKDAPVYTRAPLASQLRDTLAELADAERAPRKPHPARGRQFVSSVFDRHIDEAFAALDDLSLRQLKQPRRLSNAGRTASAPSRTCSVSSPARVKVAGIVRSTAGICRRRSRRVATSLPTG